jgi:hypothetical protein
VSFDTDCLRAASTASASRGFIAGSGAPLFAATVISRTSFVATFPRLAAFSSRFFCIHCRPIGAPRVPRSLQSDVNMTEEHRVVRIAVVSRDGISVNERFHRVADFFVFERGEDGRVEFVDRRVVKAARGRVFRDFPSLESLLSDCKVLVSLGFNGEARKELAARGFRLHEARGPIESVIRALSLDTLAAPEATPTEPAE